MPGPAKRSNSYKKAVGSRKIHSGEDLAPPLIKRLPPVPACLKDKPEGAAKWKLQCKLMMDEEILTAWDLDTIQLLCLSWQDMCNLEQDVAENGRYQKTANGYEQTRPAASDLNQVRKFCQNLMEKLGGTVVGRANMKRIKPQEAAKNKFADI